MEKEKESEDVGKIAKASDGMKKKGKNLDFQKQTCHHIFLS